MDKRLSSRISNLLLIVFLVIIVLLSVIKLMLPAEDYRQQITQRLTEVVGQPVEIIGSLEWYLSPFPSLFANSIVAPSSGVTLDEVSVSFSLLDLALFKLTPTDIKVERVTSTSSLTSVAFLEQMIIRFDPSSTIPHSFEFVINHKTQPTPLELKIRSDIKHLDTDRFLIESVLTNIGNAPHSKPALFNNASLLLDLTMGVNTSTHKFDLRLSAGNLTVASNGELKASKDEVYIELAQLKTPNMTLSGRSTWHRDKATIENTLQGTRIAIPDNCFEKPYHSNSARCYDLAILMMLPGKNSLQASTLDVHQQSVQNINLDWQFTNGEIIINHATAQAMGGTLRLKGGLALASNNWNFDLQSEHIQIEALLQAFELNPQLFGTGSIYLKGSGELKDLQFGNHKISGEVIINDGKTELFNLEKELCTQVKGVVITDSIATPFKHLIVRVEEENNHIKIPYFNSELDGATISGQGEVTQAHNVNLNMNVKLNKQEWALCKLPRALTGVDWPLTCNKQLDARGSCNINFKQMGLSALLLAEEPERKDKAKQQLKELKESQKVKKVLNRLEKWLEE